MPLAGLVSVGARGHIKGRVASPLKSVPPVPRAPILPLSGVGTIRAINMVLMFAVMALYGFLLFYRLGEVQKPIWDESYYLTSTARYELHQEQFATHPPLGLMLIAAGDMVSGVNDHIDKNGLAATKQVSGEQVPEGFNFFGIRFFSALFGTIAAGLFFTLMTKLSGRTLYALPLTGMFVFDTALVAQFRAAHLDAFQITFMLAALLCLVVAVRRERTPYWLATGVFVGLATMVRLNAIIMLAAAALPILMLVTRPGGIALIFRAGMALALGMICSIALVFAAHNLWSDAQPNPDTPAAQMDAPYMPASDVQAIDRLLAMAKGYVRYMSKDSTGFGLSDRNASSPLFWPLGVGAISYRWDSDGYYRADVALIPNYAGWLFSFAGVVLGLGMAMRRSYAGSDAQLNIALLSIWVCFMAANLWLSTQRGMYLYHYFPQLLVGWCLLALWIRKRAISQSMTRPLIIGSVAIATTFMLIAPFALHQPIEPGWRSGLVKSHLD